MRALILTLFLCASEQVPPVPVAVKAFSDRGSIFIRTPTTSPVYVGDELTVSADELGAHPLGKAVVMEVTGPLARLSLDEPSAKAKVRYVAVAKPTAPVAAVAATPAPRPAPTAPRLVGRAERAALRLVILNDSSEDWSRCDLSLADGKTFRMDSIAAHHDDTVMWLKFVGPPRAPEPLYDNVDVRCDEGETRFFFANPQSPGTLKGYAENAGGGRVVVYNSSNKPWNRCDVRKPDGSHFVLGTLDARDQNSIRPALFTQEAVREIPINSVHIRCAQGEAELPLR